jgi:hypothetical protein
MTGTTIVQNFETYVDDGTELSTTQEFSLLNKIYRKVLGYKDWSFLNKVHTGTVSGTTLALPADFDSLAENNEGASNEYGQEPVVFIGVNKTPYKIISLAQRNKYRSSAGFCYLDLANDQIVFTVAPTETEAEFNYKYVPDDIVAGTQPVFPSRYSHVLYHGMAVDDYIIQQSPKAKSYAGENQAMYASWLDQLCDWDFKQK